MYNVLESAPPYWLIMIFCHHIWRIIGSTGKMKRGYGVEGILRMLGEDKNYCETHNAYLDAIDELSIVKLLNLDLGVYDVAII